MLHGLVLLAVVLVVAPLASQIPHAVLAGILIKVGYDIIDVNYIKRAHRGPRWDLALMALVLGLTVFVDLITAVAAGVIMASLAFVKQLADLQLAEAKSEGTKARVTPEEEAMLKSANGQVLLFDFGGPLSFGAATDLGLHIRERAGKDSLALILDFHRVPFLDVSAARAVETVICDARQMGRRVFTTGMSDEVRRVLHVMEADHCLPKDAHYPDRVDAIRAAVDHVRKGSGADDGDAPEPAPVLG
jgi:SulP family sulfate permease